METHVVLAASLQQAVSAFYVGAQEGLGVCNGVVVVGLGGVVHDRIVTGNNAVEELSIADVAHDELNPILGKASDVFRVTGVGELVEHGHVYARVVVYHIVHEVAADEATAAGNDDAMRLEDVLCHATSPPLLKPGQRQHASGAFHTRSCHSARKRRRASPCQSSRSRRQSPLGQRQAGPVHARRT